MMKVDDFHEIEVVELHSTVHRTLSELLTCFRELEFTIHEDVASLDRKGDVPLWQHSSIVEVTIQCDCEEVFGFDEGEWNAIQLKYLYATLPHELTERFIDIVSGISKVLLLPIEYQGCQIDEIGLRQRFAQIRTDLLAKTGEEAGSEALAILIHQSYPRR